MNKVSKKYKICFIISLVLLIISLAAFAYNMYIFVEMINIHKQILETGGQNLEGLGLALLLILYLMIGGGILVVNIVGLIFAKTAKSYNKKKARNIIIVNILSSIITIAVFFIIYFGLI